MIVNKKGDKYMVNNNVSRSKTSEIVMTGLMTAIITLSTMFLMIPVPLTNGYIHMGDSMIFVSVLLLGWKKGAFAAGFGSMLADIFVGYAAWAPWTLVIKLLMAVIMGICLEYNSSNKKIGNVKFSVIIAMALSGSWMVLAYFGVGIVLYGGVAASAAGIPWNIVQFIIGFIIAMMVYTSLLKTPAKRYFSTLL